MQFRVFSVSVGDPSGCDDLNRFLAGHRVLTVQREFIQNGRESGWAFCVEYLGTTGGSGGSGTGFRKERVDYKAVLPPAEFAVFSRLRECRKALATKDGLPAFAICTDEQLAAMARQETLTKADLLAVEGFGEGKAAKYADALMAAHAGTQDKPVGKSES
jgi:superfamily II DNA helicase RecQ